MPKDYREVYETAEIWKQYANNTIDDIEIEGISNTQISTSNSQATYDMLGRKMNVPKRGKIFICRGKKFKYQ